MPIEQWRNARRTRHNCRGKFKYLIGWKLTRQISTLSKVNAPHCLALERACTNFRYIHCYPIHVHGVFSHSLTRSASPLGFSCNFHVYIPIAESASTCNRAYSIRESIAFLFNCTHDSVDEYIQWRWTPDEWWMLEKQLHSRRFIFAWSCPSSFIVLFLSSRWTKEDCKRNFKGKNLR